MSEETRETTPPHPDAAAAPVDGAVAEPAPPPVDDAGVAQKDNDDAAAASGGVVENTAASGNDADDAPPIKGEILIVSAPTTTTGGGAQDEGARDDGDGAGAAAASAPFSPGERGAPPVGPSAAQNISNISMDDFDDLDDGGNTLAGHSTAMSSLGMTSVVSRQRRYIVDQMAQRHAQMLREGGGAYDADYVQSLQAQGIQLGGGQAQPHPHPGQGQGLRQSQFPPLEVVPSSGSGSGSGHHSAGQHHQQQHSAPHAPSYGDYGGHHHNGHNNNNLGAFPVAHGVTVVNNATTIATPVDPHGYENANQPIDVDAFMSEPISSLGASQQLQGQGHQQHPHHNSWSQSVMDTKGGTLGANSGRADGGVEDYSNGRKGDGAVEHLGDFPQEEEQRCYKRKWVLALAIIVSMTLIAVAGVVAASRASANSSTPFDEFSEPGEPTPSPTDRYVSVYMDRFKMDLSLVSVEDFDESALGEAVNEHLSGYLTKTVTNFDRLELDVTTTSGRKNSRRSLLDSLPTVGLRRAAGGLLSHDANMPFQQQRRTSGGVTHYAVSAYFDGLVKIRSSSATSGSNNLDWNALQAVLRTVVNRAFSEPSVGMLYDKMRTAADGLSPVFEFTVFDHRGNEIGRAGGRKEVTDPPAQGPTPTPKPTDRPSLNPTTRPTPSPTTRPNPRPTTPGDPEPDPTPKPSDEPTAKPSPKPSPRSTPQPTSKPSASPTEEELPPGPTLPDTGPIASVLLKLSDASLFTVPGHPQYSAYEWILFFDGYVLDLENEAEILERYAIATFYFALGGINPMFGGEGGWTKADNFLTPTSVCTWYGIECSSDAGRVTEIDWNSNGLKGGAIPDEIRAFQALTELRLYTDSDLVDVSPNVLEGGLPDVIGELSSLEDLRMYRSGLSGAIPSSIGKLSKLKKLWLSENDHDGSIPESIGDLSNLEFINLSRNPNLGGPLPTSLGQLSELEILKIGNTKVSGTVPTQLGQLERLTFFNLQKNDLTGRIPSELGRLTNLETLWLDENDLNKGGIPSELGNLDRLEFLFLDKNRLTGEVPSELQFLWSLEELRLHDNDFIGTVPDKVSDLFANGELSEMSADCDYVVRNGDGSTTYSTGEIACPRCTCCGPTCYEG